MENKSSNHYIHYTTVHGKKNREKLCDLHRELLKEDRFWSRRVELSATEKSNSKRIHKLSKSSLMARHSKQNLKGNKLEGNPWICAADIKGC